MRISTSSVGRLLMIPLAMLALLLVTFAGARAQESFSATHLAFLDGDQEVPRVPDGGQGVAFMRFDPVSGSLEYRITVALPASDVITMAHFHRAPKGVAG